MLLQVQVKQLEVNEILLENTLLVLNSVAWLYDHQVSGHQLFLVFDLLRSLLLSEYPNFRLFNPDFLTNDLENLVH